MTATDLTLLSTIDRALEQTTVTLLSQQRADGSWQGNLSASPPSTADVLIAMYLADAKGCGDLIERGVSWLLAVQGPDGGWGDDADTCSTLNGTALAVAALTIVAPTRSQEAVRRGWERVQQMGGVDAVRDVEQCSLTVLVSFYLMLAGLMEDKDLLRVPIELALLPAPVRRKLTFAMPTAMAWGLMCAARTPGGPMRNLLNWWSTPGAIKYLDGLMGFEGPDGGFVESPMMSANVAIGLMLARQRPDIVQHCLQYFRSTIKAEGAWSVTRDLEVDATNFLTVGMQHAGLGDHPQVQQAAKWIRSAQRYEPFIWTGAPPGGWGWGLPSGWPNSGNTGDAVIALAGTGADVSDPQVRAGADWLLAQQNHDGSWSCFARMGRIASLDPSFAMVGKARSPKVLYGACAVMTAEALSGLALSNALRRSHPRLTQAYRWLQRTQHPDGAWDNRWYLGLTAGTGSVLRALGELGLANCELAHRANQWLRRHQNPDGGWGDALDTSTAEETAMALLGLISIGGNATDPVLARGARWLVEHRDPNGLWPASLLGVYFLELLYRHDHTANGYALQALARYRAIAQEPAR